MPGNFLEGLAPPIDPNMQLATGTLTMPTFSPVQLPAAQPAQPRRSILDTIGRVADVFAKVGGADPLYQANRDAELARTNAVQDRARTIDLDALKANLTRAQIGQANADAGKDWDAISSRAAGVLSALRTANPNIDVGTAWPLIARQAGLPDDRTQALGQLFQAHPENLTTVAEAMDPNTGKEKYGGSPIYAMGSDGKLHVYQANIQGGAARDILPDGVTPLDPTRAVNLGDRTAVVGTHTGNPTTILPNGVRPDTTATIAGADRRNIRDNQTRRDVAAGNNATSITNTNTRANKGAADGHGGGQLGTANMLLDNIAAGFADLHSQGALPGDQGGVGGAMAALGRTSVGQAVGEQTGNSAAQRRLSIEKDINSLQSEMVKSLPASATRTKFEQEIQRRRLPDPSRMSWQTAQAVIADLRSTFAQAQRDAAREVGGRGAPAPAAPARRTLTVQPRTPRGGRPSVSNW